MRPSSLVERVSNVFPKPHSTVVGTYAGWISAFMGSSHRGRRVGRPGWDAVNRNRTQLFKYARAGFIPRHPGPVRVAITGSPRAPGLRRPVLVPAGRGLGDLHQELVIGAGLLQLFHQ